MHIQTMDSTLKYKSAVPVLATADIPATIDYYTRVLGFMEHFIYGEPPVYAGIERDGVQLYLAHDPQMAAALKSSNLHPDVFLWVQDVDRAFEEHKARGARIIEEPADRAWDARQYVIEDPNGYRLKIAQPLDRVSRPK
jgi:catechol 2,3-dioxygenase-like lactoylglutathione lyase family enzyme